MADVLLVNPPPPRHLRQAMEHLGLGYLAAELRRSGFSADIINAPTEGLDFDGLTKEITGRSFDVLGVSVLFQDNLRPTLEWLKSLRAGGLEAHITIGGHPATFTYREILTEYDCIDSVVRGEGELAFTELAEKIESGLDWRSVDGLVFKDAAEIIANPTRPLIRDLNALVWPARDVYQTKPPGFDQLVVSGSRGCHCDCSFCSISTFYRSFKGRVWRNRDPEDVLDEIDAVRKIWPLEFVLLIDDTFIGPGKVGREQAFEFAEALGRRRKGYFIGTSCRADQVDEELFRELRKAGLRMVFLGIESGNEETLRLFNKRTDVETNRRAVEILDKLDISIEAGFIMFNPYTKFSNIQEDLNFLKQTGLGPEILSDLGLFPGEPLIEKLIADGLVTGSPFKYTAKYANDGVGEFFEFLRSRLFRRRDFGAVRMGQQMLQGAKIGVLPPSTPNLKEIEAELHNFYKVVFEVLKKGADIFEISQESETSLSALEKEFVGRCEAESDKIQNLLGQSPLITSK